MDISHLVWALLSLLSSCVLGVAIFFVRGLILKTEKSIHEVTILSERMKEVAKLEKRIEAIEVVTGNLNQLVAGEFARLNENLKWLMRNRLK